MSRSRKFIINDTFVSMRHGPVLSFTYDLIKESGLIEDDLVKESGLTADPDQRYWNENFTTVHNKFTLKEKHVSNRKHLSRMENIVAEQVLDIYKQYNQWELVRIIHEVCGEWVDTTHTIHQSTPISIQDIEKNIRHQTAEDILREIKINEPVTTV